MFALLIAAHAQAVQYNGTPVITFRVDRPAGDYVEGAATLSKVRVEHCAGGWTDVSVGAAIDPVAPNEVGIPAGDHCGLTFYWSTAVEVDGPAYTVRYSGATTTVPLATDIAPRALSPYTVVSGSMSGGGPWLLVSID
ncbi:MAG: hypothetical protein ABMA64_16065 [Myxococcota bacterium]